MSTDHVIIVAVAINLAAFIGYYIGRRFAVRRLWSDRMEWTEPFREAVRQRDQLQRENQRLHSTAFQLQVELNAYRQEAESRQWN